MLLLTAEFLSRPWCLLEIWEAHRNGVPVLPLVITPVHGQRGFDSARACSQLAALETELSPSALAVVATHLAAQQPPVPMPDFKAALMRAMGLDGGAAAARMLSRDLSWHIRGSVGV